MSTRQHSAGCGVSAIAAKKDIRNVYMTKKHLSKCIKRDHTATAKLDDSGGRNRAAEALESTEEEPSGVQGPGRGASDPPPRPGKGAGGWLSKGCGAIGREPLGSKPFPLNGFKEGQPVNGFKEGHLAFFSK